jgi:hypothetical protein
MQTAPAPPLLGRETGTDSAICARLFTETGEEIGTCASPISLNQLQEFAKSLEPGTHVLVLAHYHSSVLRDGTFSGTATQYLLSNALWLLTNDAVTRVQQLHEATTDRRQTSQSEYEYQGVTLPLITKEKLRTLFE